MAKLFASETATFCAHQVCFSGRFDYCYVPLLIFQHTPTLRTQSTILRGHLFLRRFKFLVEWDTFEICQQSDCIVMRESLRFTKEQVKYCAQSSPENCLKNILYFDRIRFELRLSHMSSKIILFKKAVTLRDHNIGSVYISF